MKTLDTDRRNHEYAIEKIKDLLAMQILTPALIERCVEKMNWHKKQIIEIKKVKGRWGAANT